MQSSVEIGAVRAGWRVLLNAVPTGAETSVVQRGAGIRAVRGATFR